jgi:phosphoribosylformylglycinamidine synthase
VETAHAFELAGGVAERWHVNRLLDEPQRLAGFQVFCIPGGFSYGDDIAAGRILGNKLQHRLANQLAAFRDTGKLILGICNGFQVLLKTNLLATADERGPVATLALNDSGRFEDRWVRLGAVPGNCPFLVGIDEMELRVTHAEGRFVARDAEAFARFEAAGQLVLRYRPLHERSERAASQRLPGGSLARGYPNAVPYPENPNGAMGDVAGICDTTGRVFGLMPHPESFIDPTQHPQWTRGGRCEAGDGLRVFQNAVRYFS